MTGHRAPTRSMLHHLFSHLIADSIDRDYQRWISSGQTLESATTEHGCVLEYSQRYRLGLIPALLIFGAVLGVAAAYELSFGSLGFWLRIAYGGIFVPLFFLMAYLSLKAWTTRITLTRDGIVVRTFGMDSLPVSWESVAVVHRSPWNASIVLTTFNGERCPISLELDGLEAFVQLSVLMKSAIFQRSAVDWYLEFNSRLKQQGIETWIVFQDQPCSDEQLASSFYSF